MDIVGLYIFSYLVGSVPTAYLIGRLVKGVDVRALGSGNVGGANVFYHVGKAWVMPLGAFEIFVKGAAPVWVGQHLLDLERSSVLLVLVPLLAIAGHNWSVFLKFQGGRGVVVAIGTVFALSPVLLAGAAVVWGAGWVLTRSSGVWVLITLALLPVGAFLRGDPLMVSLYCIGMLGLVVAKRLLSNWTPFPPDMPRKRVLFNRFFRDRDVDDRAEWVQRVPGGTL